MRSWSVLRICPDIRLDSFTKIKGSWYPAWFSKRVPSEYKFRMSPLSDRARFVRKAVHILSFELQAQRFHGFPTH